MMMKPHKFKAALNGTSAYDWAVYCEYCGLVSFHANKGDSINENKQGKAAEGCPCSPVTQEREK